MPPVPVAPGTLCLMSFLEKIWKSLDPRKRAHYERVDDELNDPGRWWEHVPSSQIEK